MSQRLAETSDAVVRCVVRQDGGWMIVTRKGRSGVATHEIPEGARVIIRDGQAVRSS